MFLRLRAVNYMQYAQSPASSAVKAPVVAAIEYYFTNRIENRMLKE